VRPCVSEPRSPPWSMSSGGCADRSGKCGPVAVHSHRSIPVPVRAIAHKTAGDRCRRYPPSNRCWRHGNTAAPHIPHRQIGLADRLYGPNPAASARRRHLVALSGEARARGRKSFQRFDIPIRRQLGRLGRQARHRVFGALLLAIANRTGSPFPRIVRVPTCQTQDTLADRCPTKTRSHIHALGCVQPVPAPPRTSTFTDVRARPIAFGAVCTARLGGMRARTWFSASMELRHGGILLGWVKRLLASLSHLRRERRP